MATIAYQLKSEVLPLSWMRMIRVRWANMANGDDGQPYSLGQGDRSVQIYGTFGVGGTVSIQQSNNDEETGQQWLIGTDTEVNALTFTAAGRKQMLEVSWQTRPIVSAGDGTTSITVDLVIMVNLKDR